MRPVRRQTDLELMRILAVFFVIFNHTGKTTFTNFTRFAPGTPMFWTGPFFAAFCKFAVPVFLMISGALLLSREPEPLGKLWVHRILRIAVILFFWTAVYFVSAANHGAHGYQLSAFAKALYTNGCEIHLWYLYAYLGFLVSLPLLQKFAKSLSNREFLYWLALFAAFTAIIPMAEYLLWNNQCKLSGDFRPDWFLTKIVFYPCLGYFLRFRIREYWNRRRLAALWLLNIAAMALTCYFTSRIYQESGITEPYDKLIFVNSMTVFVTCQYFGEKLPGDGWIHRLITSMGSCAFGIYLTHLLVIQFILDDYGFILWKLEEFELLGGLIFCTMIFLLSYALTALLKRIPVVRRLVS